MRTLARYVLPALFLCTLARADDPTPAPPPTPVPAAAPAPPARIGEPTVFSYQLPPGWVSFTVPHMYPIAVEKSGTAKAAQAKAMISVTAKSANGDLINWCAQAMQQNKAQFAALGAQVGQLEPFLTATNAVGYRAPITLVSHGRALYYIMYFFDGGDGTKLTVTCACPAHDAARYIPLFESAMKSFQPR